MGERETDSHGAILSPKPPRHSTAFTVAPLLFAPDEGPHTRRGGIHPAKKSHRPPPSGAKLPDSVDAAPKPAYLDAQRRARGSFTDPRGAQQGMILSAPTVLVGDSLTVEPRTLTPLVLVRIQVPQPTELADIFDALPISSGGHFTRRFTAPRTCHARPRPHRRRLDRRGRGHGRRLLLPDRWTELRAPCRDSA